MSNKQITRAAAIQAALGMVPSLIRKSLINDTDFHKEIGLKIDSVICINEIDASFERTDLYNAFRKSLDGNSRVELPDKNGNKWEVMLKKSDKLPLLEISNSNQQMILNEFLSLSPDKDIRLQHLSEITSYVNLPERENKIWSSILTQRCLTDDEVDEFYKDYSDTPILTAESIENVIKRGHITINSVVPTSAKYYERLIGTYNDSISIEEYASNNTRLFFDQQLSWKPYEGFLYSLLLSSHVNLTSMINIDKLSKGELIRAFEYIEARGDPISKIGAIDIGFSIVPNIREIEPILVRLISQLIIDNPDEPNSHFNLISSLFILVDSELSRSRVLRSKPPFYRRLAALAQASLICRQIINSDIEIKSFCDWACNACSERFYLQTLTDMRKEPRWNPDFATISQFKSEFMGRIYIAAAKYEKDIGDGELYNLLRKEESINVLTNLRAFFPGPLEGAEDSAKDLPANISEIIEIQLNREEVTSESFFALMNAAIIYRVKSSQADLAIKVLRLVNHRLANIDDRNQLLTVLNGLATVAAVNRNKTLADEVRILERIYRRDLQYALSITESINICITAASSRKELNEWLDYVGDWLTELAFDDVRGNDGIVFHHHLANLCQITPELWLTCGKAEAAIRAYNSRN